MPIKTAQTKARRPAAVAVAFFLVIAAISWVMKPGILPASTAKTPKKLVMAGSGTNIPITRILAEAFHKTHPDIIMDVPTSIGSTGGIRAAADGAVALGLISRPLKEKEKNLGLTIVDFAKVPLVIGVHQEVPETDITFAELVAIYKGEKNRWKNGREMVVLTREPGDSSIEVLVKGVPGFREAYDQSQQAKRWNTLLNDADMNKTLAETPNAIGLSDTGAIKAERLRIKPLKVNGVAPSVAAVAKGNYPLFKTLSYAFRQEKLTPEAKQFLDFVRSKQGAALLKANGYMPAR